MSKPTRRYRWPPENTEPYVPQEHNKIHSILTALPVIMFVAGIYFYYSAESEQSHSEPILAESKAMQGVFTGLSVVKSGQQGRHYLWFDRDGQPKGVRIKPEYAQTLDSLIRGEPVQLIVAPTVSQSQTYWALRVEQNGTVFIEAD